jgi:hypothetical protein
MEQAPIKDNARTTVDQRRTMKLGRTERWARGKGMAAFSGMNIAKKPCYTYCKSV